MLAWPGAKVVYIAIVTCFGGPLPEDGGQCRIERPLSRNYIYDNQLSCERSLEYVRREYRHLELACITSYEALL